MQVSAGRRARRIVAAAVVTLGLTPALQGQAWACSCVGPPGPPPTERQTYAEAARTGTVIYVGRVDRVRHSGTKPGGTNTYTITVTEALKGPRAAQRTLSTPDNGGTCGVVLTLKKPILVVDNGAGTVGSCDEWTTQERVPQRAAIVRDALREPTMPRTGGGVPAAWTLLAVAGAFGLRRLRAT